MRKLLLFAACLFSSCCLAQTRPAITGIAFMRLYASDVPAAEHFYGKLMGYDEKHLGDTTVFPINQHQWVEVIPSGSRANQSYLSAIGFTVADLGAMKQYLAAKGVKDVQAPQAGTLTVTDPERNTICFVQAGAPGAVADLAAHTPLSPRAPSHRMIHAGFVVHDRAKEDAFWMDILGFRAYWFGGTHMPSPDWVSMQVPEGSDWIEYMMKPDQPLSQHDLGVSNHFSLGVERMQTVLHDLQRNGCEDKMCLAIQAGKDGKLQLNLFDPDQTRVEYMEFAPVMEPCCSPFTAPHPRLDQQ